MSVVSYKGTLHKKCPNRSVRVVIGTKGNLIRRQFSFKKYGGERRTNKVIDKWVNQTFKERNLPKNWPVHKHVILGKDAWVVSFRSGQFNYRKEFRIDSPDQDQKVKQVAQKHYENFALKHKLVFTSTPPQRTHVVDLSSQEYISGFFDGDGSVGIYKSAGAMLNFAQSRDSGVPDVLIFIQEKYGTTTMSNDKRGNKRRSYRINYSHNDVLWDIARDLHDHTIVKQPELKTVLQYLQHCLTSNYGPGDPLGIISKLKSHKKQKYTYTLTNIDKIRLTHAYVAGLFDAEGCVCLSCKRLNVSLAQSGCPSILRAINEKYQVGTVVIAATSNLNHFNKAYWRINGTEAKSFLESILPYSIVKRDQIRLALDYIRLMEVTAGTKRKRISDDNHLKRDHISRELKRLKKL
jgi:hypothetical protein